MRNKEIWPGAAAWIAVAVLMPLSALEPVTTAHATRTAALSIPACEDGSPRLVLGCASMSL